MGRKWDIYAWSLLPEHGHAETCDWGVLVVVHTAHLGSVLLQVGVQGSLLPLLLNHHRSGHYPNSASYSIQQSRIIVMCGFFFSKRQSKLPSVILKGVLGCPRILDSVLLLVVLEATHKVRLKALKGRCVSSKKPSRIRDQVVSSCEEWKRKTCFLKSI